MSNLRLSQIHNRFLNLSQSLLHFLIQILDSKLHLHPTHVLHQSLLVCLSLSLNL